MPAHIPASVGGGTSPPCGENQQWQNVQIGPSYYRPTYTAASQCIGVLGRTSPLAKKMTTSELSNQLTPGSGPQKENLCPPTFRPPPKRGGAPSSGQNQQPAKRPNWTKLLPANLLGRLAIHWYSRANKPSNGKNNN